MGYCSAWRSDSLIVHSFVPRIHSRGHSTSLMTIRFHSQTGQSIRTIYNWNMDRRRMTNDIALLSPEYLTCLTGYNSRQSSRWRQECQWTFWCRMAASEFRNYNAMQAGDSFTLQPTPTRLSNSSMPEAASAVSHCLSSQTSRNSVTALILLISELRGRSRLESE